MLQRSAYLDPDSRNLGGRQDVVAFALGLIRWAASIFSMFSRPHLCSWSFPVLSPVPSAMVRSLGSESGTAVDGKAVGAAVDDKAVSPDVVTVGTTAQGTGQLRRSLKVEVSVVSARI